MTYRFARTFLALASVLGIYSSFAAAQVPAGYTGTPFGGTPRAIPGRIDFEDFDDGGEDVAWRQDDDTGTQFGDGCAGNDYRPVNPHPQLCETNPTEGDTYSEGPLMGMPYPTDASASIYIGYTHVGEWVKVTVDVKQAGTYLLSSTWASEGGGADGIKFQLSFNDVLKADVTLPGTGGYHNWVAAEGFAMVELDAGVQVLEFVAGSQHLNYDYLQLSLMLPGGGVDDGSGAAAGAGGTSGAGGAGGEAAGGAGGEAAGGTGGTVQGGAGGTGATSAGGVPAASAGTGGLPAAAGNTGVAAAGSTAVALPNAAGASADASATNVDTASGCSLGVPSSGRSLGAFAALAAALWVAAQRRRRA